VLTRGKIALSYRPCHGPPFGAPPSVPSLAGSLREGRFEVVRIGASIKVRHLARIAGVSASAIGIGRLLVAGQGLPAELLAPGDDQW
jgi:hypothetical protein